MLACSEWHTQRPCVAHTSAGKKLVTHRYEQSRFQTFVNPSCANNMCATTLRLDAIKGVAQRCIARSRRCATSVCALHDHVCDLSTEACASQTRSLVLKDTE